MKNIDWNYYNLTYDDPGGPVMRLEEDLPLFQEPQPLPQTLGGKVAHGFAYVLLLGVIGYMFVAL